MDFFFVIWISLAICINALCTGTTKNTPCVLSFVRFDFFIKFFNAFLRHLLAIYNFISSFLSPLAHTHARTRRDRKNTFAFFDAIHFDQSDLNDTSHWLFRTHGICGMTHESHAMPIFCSVFLASVYGWVSEWGCVCMCHFVLVPK